MSWTEDEMDFGFGGSGDLHCYPTREQALDGIYLECTSVRPMTNHIDVTFKYNSTTKGPYRLTQNGQTPTITDIGGVDVITDVCGVNESPENSYDVTVIIHLGRN